MLLWSLTLKASLDASIFISLPKPLSSSPSLHLFFLLRQASNVMLYCVSLCYLFWTFTNKSRLSANICKLLYRILVIRTQYILRLLHRRLDIQRYLKSIIIVQSYGIVQFYNLFTINYFFSENLWIFNLTAICRCIYNIHCCRKNIWVVFPVVIFFKCYNYSITINDIY